MSPLRPVHAMRTLVMLFLVLGLHGLAWAHKASDSLLAISPAAGELSVRWDIALRDLDPVLAIDRDEDGHLRWKELRQRLPEIERFAMDSIGFHDAAGSCGTGGVDYALARRGGGAYLRLSFSVRCGSPIDRIGIDYRLFERIDPTHRALLRVGAADASAPSAGLEVLVPGSAIRWVELAGGPGTRIGDFVAQGAHHILIGVDHLAFLLALLVAAIGVARLESRRVSRTLGDLALTVTLFTVAHSLTLSAAALGWLMPPARGVEILIAATVVLAGLHAWPVRRAFPSKLMHALVFAFGLIHGFGFATALREAGLMRDGGILALLGFNAGVEIGQLLVLGIAFPMVWAASASRRLHPIVARGAAVAIALAGFGWLVERSFDIDLLGSVATVQAARLSIRIPI